MSESCVICAPVTQLCMPWKSEVRHIGTVEIREFDAEFRRRLLDAAHRDRASDDIISLAVEAEAIIVISVPEPWPVPGSKLMSAALYREIADSLVRRLFDCMRLFIDVPELPERLCWFVITGSFDSKETQIGALDSNWRDDASADRTRITEDVTAEGLACVLSHWDRLQVWCQVPELNRVYADSDRQKGYVAAGNAEVQRLSEDRARSLLEERKSYEDPATSSTIKIPSQTSAKWFIEGYLRAFRRSLQRLDLSRYSDRPSARFLRAFQIFVDSHRLKEPHRFVARVGCLESLLSRGTGELSFQLASRIAWLLAPSDGAERLRLSKLNRDIYALRSTIAHGSRFKLTELEALEPRLLEICRRVLATIVTVPTAFKALCMDGQEGSDAYLDSLILGAAERP